MNLKLPFGLSMLCAVLLWTGAVADDVKSPADIERGRLEGQWRAVAMEMSGKVVDRKEFASKLAQRMIPPQRLELNGKRYYYQSGMRGLARMYAVDPEKSPKWIDVSSERDPNSTWKGIYELDGGMLKVFLNYAGERPTEFATRDQSGETIVIYERVKGDQGE